MLLRRGLQTPILRVLLSEAAAAAPELPPMADRTEMEQSGPRMQQAAEPGSLRSAAGPRRLKRAMERHGKALEAYGTALAAERKGLAEHPLVGWAVADGTGSSAEPVAPAGVPPSVALAGISGGAFRLRAVGERAIDGGHYLE